MDGIEYLSPSKTVLKKVGDPFIYLLVGNEWYCYNPDMTSLGGGAMGTVFLGYRVSNGARIAVKRVKDAFANQPVIRQRARQEASLAFRHQNLIEILGFCEWDAALGPLFILSNYVQGEGIKSFIKNLDGSPDRTKRIVEMMYSVLDALDYIHSRGIVHRDVKPSNIMVEEGSNVRLMDLGIARMNGGNQYSSYGFIGTPQYAAPEQILRTENPSPGDGEINASTDVYAAGITLFELLAGYNPFDSARNDEVLANQMTKTLPADPAIPRKLMKVILKATEKRQPNRYKSIAEFRAALEEAMSENGGASNKVIDWVKDNPLIVVCAALGILAIIVALILLR